MKYVYVLCGLVAALSFSTPSDAGYLDELSDEINSDEHGQSLGKFKTNCTCGTTNKAASRIVGGKETEVNEYPFIVALVRIISGGGLSQFCGATIITEYHALTAAHCVVDEDENIGILAGEHNLLLDTESSYTKFYRVSEKIPHVLYNRNTFKHDIALLVTENRIEFNKAVGPACLPTVPIEVNQYVKVTGWGDLRFEGPEATRLRKVWLRVISLEECSRKHRKTPIDTYRPTQFCTYGFMKDSCQGDSGGPVTWLDPLTNRYTLAGVVSYGVGCATTYPGINTDVLSYMSWILRNIHSSAPRSVKTCTRE